MPIKNECIAFQTGYTKPILTPVDGGTRAHVTEKDWHHLQQGK